MIEDICTVVSNIMSTEAIRISSLNALHNANMLSNCNINQCFNNVDTIHETNVSTEYLYIPFIAVILYLTRPKSVLNLKR